MNEKLILIIIVTLIISITGIVVFQMVLAKDNVLQSGEIFIFQTDAAGADVTFLSPEARERTRYSSPIYQSLTYREVLIIEQTIKQRVHP